MVSVKRSFRFRPSVKASITGGSAGPSTFPPLIPELRHEDDDMSGDAQGFSADTNDDEGTDFEGVQESDYFTDAPTGHTSMANPDTDYYSADTDVPMDASGVDEDRSHTS